MTIRVTTGRLRHAIRHVTIGIGRARQGDVWITAARRAPALCHVTGLPLFSGLWPAAGGWRRFRAAGSGCAGCLQSGTGRHPSDRMGLQI